MLPFTYRDGLHAPVLIKKPVKNSWATTSLLLAHVGIKGRKKITLLFQTEEKLMKWSGNSMDILCLYMKEKTDTIVLLSHGSDFRKISSFILGSALAIIGAILIVAFSQKVSCFLTTILSFSTA